MKLSYYVTSVLLIIMLELFNKNVTYAALPVRSTTNSLSRSSDVSSSSCKCNLTEIFTQLPYLIQAIGMDDRTKFTFKGDRGERGPDGPHGPQGIQGFPGRKGERGESGRDGLPGPRSVGEKGEQGSSGITGNMGRKGQKGEAAPHVYQRRLLDGNVVEIKGEKGDGGKRGRKGDQGERGDSGVSGLPGISIQGEKGAKGEPSEIPNTDELKGPIGPRGPPGLPGRRGICRGCQFANKLGKEEQGPIFIPMQGDPGPQGIPGLAVVGQKGEPGEPGPPAPVSTSELSPSLPLQFSSDEHLKVSTSHPVGTLAFITKDESFFIYTRRGWREIALGRFLTSLSDRRRQFDVGMHPRDWSRLH